MLYRKEIDGLRAFAVIPVILFHAGFTTFKGGFVGVDIFFVISGYLITTKILYDLEIGTFSILNFFESRARRVLPALFLVMLITIPFAWLQLLPSEMKDFSQSLIAATLFSSNIFFWRKSNYFEPGAEFYPLQHTWSLSIEEQFYVLFPIYLILIWKFGNRFILRSLGLFFIISFTLAEWANQEKPSAAFYLLPTRGWELLIGVFTAFITIRTYRKEIFGRPSEVCGWLGIAMIFVAIFIFNKNTPFPGVYTLVPTLGTALIILFATHNTTAGKFLANKIFVNIGLISYSAYLWHQPIFVFARYYGFLGLNTNVFYLLIVLVFIAYASWKYVENPFRNKTKTNKLTLLNLSIVFCFFFIAFGLLVHKKSGNLGQLTSEQENFLNYFENEIPTQKYFNREKISDKYRGECDFYDIRSLLSGNETRVPVSGISESCFTTKNKESKVIFIWGDSHAQTLNFGVNSVLQNGFEVLQIASSGCIASMKAHESKSDYCEQSNWFALKTIKAIKPHTVIIGQNLGHDLINMQKLTLALKQSGVQRVIFVGPTPHWIPTLPSVAVRMFPSVPERTFRGINNEVLILDQKLKSESMNYKSFEYISLIDFFCNSDGCLIHYNSDIAASLTSWDYGHLTPIASLRLANELLSPIILRN